jgi:hypothetical protein
LTDTVGGAGDDGDFVLVTFGHANHPLMIVMRVALRSFVITGPRASASPGDPA